MISPLARARRFVKPANVPRALIYLIASRRKSFRRAQGIWLYMCICTSVLSSRSSVKVASFACERAARRFHAELSSDDSFRARARRLCGIIAMGRERDV